MPVTEWFKKRRGILGMDLGSSGVKFVRLRGKGEAALAVSHWYYPGAVYEEGAAEISSLRSFLMKNELGGSPVACNIEENSLKIRRVELPKMPDADLKEAVRWQLRDVVEGPVSEYNVRYSLLEEVSTGETQRLSLIAYAIKKNEIFRLVDFLRQLSLSPVLIEPTSVSLLAAFDALIGWKKEEYYGVIDFGEKSTVFIALNDRKIFFSRPLPGVSGRDLQAAFQKEWNLSPAESEEMKRYFMGKELSLPRLSPLLERAAVTLQAFYTKTAVEIQKSLDAFYLMFRKEKVHYLFLCGGGGSLRGLKDSLAKNLAIPTSLLDPTQKFKMEPALEMPAPVYDVALGLALYGM